MMRGTWGTEAGREPGAGGGVAGGAEARAAAEVGAGEPGGAGGEGEGVDPGQSGTPLPGREAAVQRSAVHTLYTCHSERSAAQ